MSQPFFLSNQAVWKYVTMVPRVGNETLRPLGVAMGNTLSVTRGLEGVPHSDP